MTAFQGDRDRWVRVFHRSPDAPVRLVCFPHAGGAASYFHALSALLAPGVEVRIVQYPGRQERYREEPIDDIGVLAERIAAVLDGDFARPTAFLGHSMGATVAFETTRLLERRGTGAPELLYVSGRRAPGIVVDERVHERDDAGLLDELRALSGTDDGVLGDDELVQMILPALRSDYRAIETYRAEAGARVRCPVTVLVGDADPKARIADVAGWEEHTDGPFAIEVFPGGHFYLADHLPQIAERVSAELAR